MKKVSPAMIVALISLFVALTGTAGAAFVLGANTVGTAQIKNGSIRLTDIAPTTVNLLKGQTGAQGPIGPVGAPGIQGPAGLPGAAGGFNPAKLSYTFASQSTVGPGSSGDSTALCTNGGAAVGGGGLSSIGKLATSWAVVNPNGWKISVYNDTGITITIAAFVVCSTS